MHKKITAALLALIQILMLSTGVFAEDEEDEVEYFSGTAALGAWQVRSTSGECGFTYDLVENVYHGKTFHASKMLGEKSNVYAIIWQTIPIEEGATYRYSYAVKSKDVYGVCTSIDYEERVDVTPMGETFDWLEPEGYYENEGESRDIEFQVIFNGSVKDIWLDDFTFRKVNEDGSLGPNLLSDWGFEIDQTEPERVDSEYEPENIIYYMGEEGSGSEEDFLKAVTVENAIPVYNRTIKVDGNLSDWDEYKQIQLPSSYSQIGILTEYHGAEDLNAEVGVAYDNEKIYVSAKVHDDIWNEGGSAAWEKDSIQINFGHKGNDNFYGYGFNPNKATGKVAVSVNEGSQEDLDKISAKATFVDDNTIVYEISFKKELFYNGDLTDLTFNLLVNDNDESGRAAYLQWKPGLGEGATSGTGNGLLKFVKDETDLLAWFEKDLGTIQMKKNYKAVLRLYNPSDNERVVKITDSTGESEVTVPAHGVIFTTVKVKTAAPSYQMLSVELAYDEGKTQTVSLAATAAIDTQFYIDKFKQIESTYMPEINKLMAECENNGINLDYESADLFVIERFLDYGVEDAQDDRKERSEYVFECLVDICAQLIQRLKGYLDGTAVPRPSKPYLTSRAVIDGQSFLTTDADGEQRPTYFMGYGHFDGARWDMKNFPQIGANVVQLEIGPASAVLGGSAASGYTINDAYIQYAVIDALQTCYENNVQLCLLLSPHYIPNWLPAEATTAEYFDQHIEMRAMLEAYIKAVVTAISESPYRDALNSLTLTNETTHQAASEEELPFYREWLAEFWNGDVAAMNDAYGTEYTSFDEVQFPDKDVLYDSPTDERSIPGLPQYVDWLEFNEQYLTDFHAWMYEVVQSVDPTIPCHTKVMQAFDSNEREWRRKFINVGTDPELLAYALPINGNDANNYFMNSLWGILNKMSYYDLQTSSKRAPVFDTEDHVIVDRDADYRRNVYRENHIGADMWQGAIHGRGGSTMWVWERTTDPGSDFEGSILHRPDMLLNASHTMMDVNRLAWEIQALQNTKRTIGILYAKTSRAYSMRFTNSLVTCYEAASYLGERIEFVTEKQAREGKLTNSEDIQILLVPNITHLLEGALDDIKAFIEKGGTVYICGNDALQYTQYNKPQNTEVRDFIFANSTVLNMTPTPDARDTFDAPTAKDIWNVLVQGEENSDYDTPVTITDAITGNRVYGVSYFTAEYEDNLLINICDYEYTPGRKIDIRYNGQIIEEGVELRSGLKISGENVALEPYYPILVSVPLEELPSPVTEFTDEIEHWSRYSVFDLRDSGIVNGTSETTFTPDAVVTVSQFAAMLGRAAGKGDTAYLNLIDAEPEAPITREQMAHMLVTVYKELKGETPEIIDLGFTDISRSKYKNDINLAVTLGYLTGYSSTEMGPKNTTTRAEAAATMRRFNYSLKYEVEIMVPGSTAPPPPYKDTLILFESIE